MSDEPSGGGTNLPPWLRFPAIAVLVITLVVHIFVDAFNKSYEGASISLMLGGTVGTALGINEWLQGRNGGGPK